MAIPRPQRSAQRTTYEGMMESDPEDTGPEDGLSDLSSELSDDSLSHRSSSEETTSRAEVIHLPTASDILETQEHILSKTAELNAFDTEYQAAKRNFEVAEAKRNAILRDLLKSKAYLARVRTLPQEVLGLVFQFYTLDPAQSPWTLMQVTRTWRATALCTGSIWSRLLLTSPAWQKTGVGRRKDGREICGTKEQLGRALKRARRAPLDITLELTNPHGKVTYRKYDRTAMCDMLVLLASSQKCLQVHHLSIDGECRYNLRWLDHHDDMGLRFPELRTLRVKSPSCEEFVAKVSTSSKKLEEAQLMLPSPYGGHPGLGFTELVKYSTLTTLILDGRIAHGHDAARLEALTNLLATASSITTLELTRVHAYPDPAEAPILSFPNLTTLALHRDSRLWAFDAPALTHLVLNGDCYLRKGAPGSNNFPLLSSLTINARHIWDRPPGWLALMKFPPLHTLNISLGRDKEELKEVLRHLERLSPIVFCVRKTTISQALLIGTLSGMERLEELQLEGVPLTKNFFHSLGSKRDEGEEDGSDGLPCPRLVRLRLDLNGSRAQKKNLKVLVRKMVQARVNNGIAMETCLLRFADEERWLNLV